MTCTGPTPLLSTCWPTSGCGAPAAFSVNVVDNTHYQYPIFLLEPQSVGHGGRQKRRSRGRPEGTRAIGDGEVPAAEERFDCFAEGVVVGGGDLSGGEEKERERDNEISHNVIHE